MLEKISVASEIYVSLMVYYKDYCFLLCFKEILTIQHKVLHCDELAWTLLMCAYYLNSSINGALTGLQVEPQDSFV